MISIIICSLNRVALNNLKANIEDTIGVPYEILDIDNSGGQYGICKAYNEGAMRSKFPILCFMHEDIFFETRDWGRLVSVHLADQATGLLGVAGGDAKSLVPSSWSVPVVTNEINVFQHYRSSGETARHIVVTDPGNKANKKKVVVVDGLWLCTKREVFDQFRFDDAVFKGFHGYDIDYSLQVFTKFNVYVIFDIVIHHYSEGKPDRKWVDSAILVSKKWKDHLPIAANPLPGREYTLHHWRSMQAFLHRLFQLNYKHIEIFYFFFFYSFNRFFRLRRFLSMAKYVVISMFKQKSNPSRNHQALQ